MKVDKTLHWKNILHYIKPFLQNTILWSKYIMYVYTFCLFLKAETILFIFILVIVSISSCTTFRSRKNIMLQRLFQTFFLKRKEKTSM